MIPTRRAVLEGALVVSFGAFLPDAQAQSAFGTNRSHVDASKLDSWLKVGANGAIVAYTGKCDLGQGMFTAQTQLVAEELCVALAQVALVQCDTEVCPDQGTTSGSQSTPVNFNSENLALAAATAREALLAMAAEKLGEPVSALSVANGVVAGKSGKVAYAELIGARHFNLTLNPNARRKPRSQWTVLGKPVPSLDRPKLMTGRFEFVHTVRVPGMVHGAVVRPPRMGATLAAVDRSSVPGNVQVVVKKDFVGVVTDSPYHAQAAAKKLKVSWNPGPPLPAPDTFFADMQKQPSYDSLSVDSGDVAEDADGQVLRARYTYPFQMHGSIGSSCAVADVKKDGATIWSPTQSAYPSRSVAAMLLGVPLDRVRVIYVRGSGCYGLNGADAVTFDAAILSQAVGKPVRLQYTRADEMLWENFGNPVVVEQRAVLKDGRIVLWDRENWVASLGSRPGYERPGNVISGKLLGYAPEPFTPGPATPPTRFRNGSNAVPPYLAGCVDGTCGSGGTVKRERVLTHTVPSPFFTGPLRSPQRIQNTFANECFMDELAHQAGADPLEFRLAHLGHPRLIAVLRRAADASGWRAGPSARQAATSGIARGRGLATVAYEGTNGYVALVADVEVDLATGMVRPIRFVAALDCGPVSNPDGLRNQVEGGLLQGTSRSLVEEVRWDRTRVLSHDWRSYPSLSLGFAMPKVECVFVEPEGVAATGAGETAITVAPAAIGNAIFDATGVRLRDVPFTPERMLAALRQRH